MRSTGVEINSSAVRVVQLEKKGLNVKLVQAITLPTFAFGSRVLGERGEMLARVDDLMDRVAAAGIPLRGGITGITGRELMLRYIEVPEDNEERQQLLVNMEVDDLNERSEEELCYDHTVLFDVESQGTATAVLAIAKDAFLQQIHDRLGRLQVPPTQIMPNALGLYHGFLLGGVTNPGETVVLLSVGYEETEVAIVREGMLVFARNLSAGIAPMAELFGEALEQRGSDASPEAALKTLFARGDVTPEKGRPAGIKGALTQKADELFRSFESSLSFARLQLKQPKMRFDRVMLAGEMSRIKGAAPFLQARFGRPVEAFDPFGLLAEIDLPEMLARGEHTPAKTAGAYTVAAGLAAAGLDSSSQATVNLEAARVKEQRQFRHGTIYLYAACLVVLLALGASLFAANGYAANAEEVRDTEERKVRDYRQVSEQIQDAYPEPEPVDGAGGRTVRGSRNTPTETKPDIEERLQREIRLLHATAYATEQYLAIRRATREFLNPTGTTPNGQGNDEIIEIRHSLNEPDGADLDEPYTMTIVVVFEQRTRTPAELLSEFEAWILQECGQYLEQGGFRTDSNDDRDVVEEGMQGTEFTITLRLAPPPTPDVN